jgi:hypothetical protein
MKNPKLKGFVIEDANENDAFITGEPHGYDVAILSRYTVKHIRHEDHLNNALTDKQWQKLVDIVAEALKNAKL